MKHYKIDQHRRARGEPDRASLDGIEVEEALVAQASDVEPAEFFDRRWASGILFQALQRCEAHYRGNNKTRNWEAYDAWKIRPAITGCKPPSREVLAKDLGFRNGADLSQAVQTVDRELTLTILPEIVAETMDTANTAEIASEVRYIRSLLS